MNNTMNVKISRYSIPAGRTTIGFFNWEIGRDWSLASWLGVGDAAQQHDVNLISFVGGIVSPPQSWPEQANILYALADAERLDGLIVFNSGLTANLAESERAAFCRRPGVPVVTIEGAIPGTPCITYGNYEGICAVMEHLIEVHGYRRIAFVGLHDQQIGFRERWRAYTDSMQKYDLPIKEELFYPFFSDYFSEEFFQRNKGPVPTECVEQMITAGAEAIVGICDWTSIHLMNMLQARNVRIPQDIAVVSFDDYPESRVLTPSLTTVNPGWHELGQQAVKSLLDLLDGRSVSPQIPVPPRLMVRQSCGCLDAEVKHAAVTAHLEKSPAPIYDHSHIALSMLHAVSGSLSAEIGQLVDDLLHGFVADLRNEDPESFLGSWDTLLRHVVVHDGELSVWHDALSALRRETLGWVQATGTTAQAENLWQQARVLLGKLMERVQAQRRLHAEEQFNRLRSLGEALITTFDAGQLMDVLAEQLPQFGISRCYLALYESPVAYAYPAPAPEWSRLILAYAEGERAALPSDGLRFRSHGLVPPHLFGTTRANLIVKPLYFQHEQIGFVIFEPGPPDGGIYEALRSQISSALQGALLVQRVQERSAEIVRQKYILDTFMENVPDSIYFKDRDSRFLQMNQSHAARFRLKSPAEAIGKTDFDFFPEEDARPKYEAEQDIIRTGQPILAQEEPDTGGRWTLTTKMPLRDEHGVIIGTFGISRDITELKKAQQALQSAYSEISVLNTQLQEENVRMGAELNVVKQLQQMILPRPQELQAIPGLDLAGYMQPADEVGGDYYDILHDHDLLHIGIGDVTGHGLESGVIMLMTQAAIRTLIEHGETDPVKFVNTLNRLIYKNAARIGTDKNLTFTLVQYQQGQLKIVGQHEEVLVVRQSGHLERVDTIQLGFQVGLLDDISQWVKSAAITLQSGDGIVLYTDGITEAENTDKQQYGLDRLCAVVSQHWGHSAEAIKQAVVEDVTAYIGTQKVYDDITLVVLKQK